MKVLGGEMFSAMSGYVADFRSAHEAGRGLGLPELRDVDHVFLTGMGGSGIGASLAASLCRDSSRVPVLVVKDYYLPKFVGKRSLVVATSYSGETEETLLALAQAKEAGAHLAGISSGGTLSAFLERHKHPLFRVPAGRQPRAALPLLFGGLAGMLERVGAAKLALPSSDEKLLQDRLATVQPDAPADANGARKVAELVARTSPTIVGEGPLADVAVRWKGQVNENAKRFARAEALPEANHNDLVAWAHAPKGPQDALVLLRAPDETPATRTRFEFLQEVAAKDRVPSATVRCEGSTPLARVLNGLIVGDYASVFAAQLQGIDPTPVPIIGSLKERLQTHGLASEAKRRLGT